MQIIHNAIDVERFVFHPQKRAEVREQLGLNGKLVPFIRSQKDNGAIKKVFTIIRKIILI